MKIPVMKISQAGKVLYLGSMTAQQMLDSCITTEWDPNIGWNLNNQGYQREPHQKHYKGIAKYLSMAGNPFMPNGALLSSRDREYGLLKFRSIESGGDAEFGYLELPEGRQLFIVDYQHRLRGFRQVIEEEGRDEFKEYIIPITIMPDVERYEEIQQFYVINSKQRRIDTDLALALLQTMAGAASEDELVALVGPGKKYRIRATRLSFKLASHATGPWAGRIKQPHDLPEPNAVLKVKSFADSLQPILSSRSPVSDLDDDRLIGLIGNYWSALNQLMAEAFRSPRDYLIQKTLGVYSMHIVAAKTVLKLCQKKDDYSADRMRTYLAAANDAVGQHPAKYMESDFWVGKGQVKQYSGSGGYRSLATLIREKIEAKYPIA